MLVRGRGDEGALGVLGGELVEASMAWSWLRAVAIFGSGNFGRLGRRCRGTCGVGWQRSIG